MNGRSEFRGHARAPLNTKQIQAMAAEIYSVAIGRAGFRELYIFFGVPVRQPQPRPLACRIWDICDIVALIGADEAKAVQAKRGPYKKRIACNAFVYR